MKYSIVMPHLRRAEQLRRTLQSFRYHYAGRDDWDVVLVIDSKNDDNVGAVIDEFPSLRIMATTTGRADKYNPSPAFNVGVAVAGGEYVIITNPECLHHANVLDILDAEFAACPRAYVMCGCESAKDCAVEFVSPEAFTYQHHMWYQHSHHRNLKYHFCSAMAKVTYQRVGGFDERFADGIAYDDDAFRDRVINAGVPIIARDDALTIHQKHPRLSLGLSSQEKHALVARNKKLYAQLYRGGKAA